MGEAPRRAFHLTLILGADSREELADALRQMASQVDQLKLTVGVSGGPSSGAIYELLSNPEQTHERYFQEVAEYLRKRKEPGNA
jgi:hypothetical protein